MHTITLFGYPAVLVGNEPVSNFVSNKSMAVLIYTAVTRQRHSRDKLAGLFWGDMPESKAKASLRSALYNLQQLLPDVLDIRRKSVALSEDAAVSIDVHTFATTLAQSNLPVEVLRQLLNLYQADFLEGFHIADAPEFEAWLFLERERLRYLAVDAFNKLALADREQGNLHQAIKSLRQLLRLEAWRESTHRDLMLLLARVGDYNGALRQYEQCRQMLADELSVEPTAETVALQERIGRLRYRPPQDHVPLAPDLLVGRQRVLGQLRALLADPQMRLITLVGMGGIGKTQLALTMAASQPAHFLEGVHFISLESVTQAAALPLAIIRGLDIHLPTMTDPQTALFDYLQGRELLLILDNFEQIVDGGAELLARLLYQAPQLKMLVTSRVRLQVQHEKVIMLAGLTYPNSVLSASEAMHYPAVALFTHTAQRVYPQFELATHLNSVIEICQMVDGLPLALELAAAQTAVLPIDQIAAQISHKATALTTMYRDVSPRHRSMRAVFDQSWQQLSESEQVMLARLSVFQGNFTLQAVEAIMDDVETAVSTLAPLVAKSLVGLSDLSQGLYSLHPLLHEFAAEKLVGDSYAPVKSRWAHYFLQLLLADHCQLRGPHYEMARATLDIVWENIRLAWLWAVERQETALLSDVLSMFAQYCDFSNRYIELEMLLSQAEEAFREATDGASKHLLACLQVTLTHHLLNMGQLTRAKRYFEASYPVLMAATDAAYLSDWYRQQAQHYRDLAHPLDKALEISKTSCKWAAQSGDCWIQGASFLVLGNLQFDNEAYKQAEESWFVALSFFQQMESQWGELAVLVSLARAADAQGLNVRAKNLYEQGLVQARGLSNDAIIKAALSGLGGLALQAGDWTQATAYFDEYRQIALANGNVWEEAEAELCLGKVAQAQMAHTLAYKHYQRAARLNEKYHLNYEQPKQRLADLVKA